MCIFGETFPSGQYKDMAYEQIALTIYIQKV